MTAATVQDRQTRRRAAPATARHRLSHARLLHRVDVPTLFEDVDAIIVPTARPAVYLRDSLELAKSLGCPLVAVCSQDASARQAYLEARRIGAYLVATELSADPRLPPFETSRLPAQPQLRRRGDTSLKRNIGLALARMQEWQRIVFLDDDITSIQPGDMRAAAGLLDRYSMVGLRNNGFPDNSVVCHALRAIGIDQDTFVGGGAMAVPAARTTTFFPNIYNEDWFFLLDEDGLSPTAVTGWMTQKRYDPFRDENRARNEEFGDCLAEGVFALLDDGKSVNEADEGFWRSFLDDRRALIEDIISAIPVLRLPADERRRMTGAMRAAQARRLHISPGLCSSYMDAIAADRARWRTFINELPKDLSVRKALQHLGLDSTQIYLPR